MDICLPIRDIYVRKILDSGGSPAVEAEVLAGEDIVGTASVAGQKGEQEIEAGIEQMHSQIAEELSRKRSTIYSKKEKRSRRKYHWQFPSRQQGQRQES